MITFVHKELTRVLDLAASGVSKQENVEQGDSFVFKGGRVHTFNNEVAVSCALPSVPGVDVLEGAVNAKRLLALMKVWGDSSVSFGIKEGKELSIMGTKTRSGMKLQPDILLAIGTEGNADPSSIITLDPKTFVNAIKVVMPTASTDEQCPGLCGVHIGSDASGTFAEATDKTQICRSYFSREHLFTHDGFFIPNDAARELAKFAPSAVGTNGSWVHFDCGDCTFACRTLGQPFPKTAPLLATPSDASEVEFTHPIDDAIGRVALSAGTAGSVKFLVVRTMPDKKVVRIEGSTDRDWAKEIVDAASSEELAFAVDIEKLREAMTHAQSLKVKLTSNGGGMIYASSENTDYVASLIVLGAAQEADAAEKKEEAAPKKETTAKTAKKKPPKVAPEDDDFDTE